MVVNPGSLWLAPSSSDQYGPNGLVVPPSQDDMVVRAANTRPVIILYIAAAKMFGTREPKRRRGVFKRSRTET